MSYYKMERGWLDSPMWGEDAYSKREAFEWLIGEAAWDDSKIVATPNGKPFRLKRGQVYASIRFMARKFQWSENKVIRYLDFLSVWGAVKTETNTGQTVITICNYSKYQDGGNTVEYSDEHADGNANGDADGVADEYKQQETQEKNITTTRARGVSRETVEKPEDVTPETWADYAALRKQHKAPLTATALDGIRREAVKAGWSLQQALAECCARGWRGFKAEWVDKNQKGSGNANARQFGGNDGYKGSGNPRGKHERARNILLGDPSAPIVEG